MTTEITSSTNPSLKVWRSLQSARGIKRHHLAIVSGERIVSDLLRSHTGDIQACLISNRFQGETPELPGAVKLFRLEDALFQELDMFGTHSPLLVVRVPEIEPFRPSDTPAPLTLFLPFQDPANLGAVIRSAAAFEVPAIVLLEEAASPYHPKSIRASGGAVFSVKLFRGPSIRETDIPGVPLIGLSSDGEPLDAFTFPAPCALLPGMEGPGLPDIPGLAAKLAIPMSPAVESLNATVAVSIALYEWRMQTRKR